MLTKNILVLAFAVFVAASPVPNDKPTTTKAATPTGSTGGDALAGDNQKEGGERNQGGRGGRGGGRGGNSQGRQQRQQEA